MKDEIKEILDRLDYNEWDVDLYKVPITWCELYDIRDYITNLQEENERLKEQLEYLRSGEYLNQVKWERDLNENLNQTLGIELEDYKSRIEKAIEYIKCWQSFPHTNCTTHNELKNLLNILQGDDKE